MRNLRPSGETTNRFLPKSAVLGTRNKPVEAPSRIRDPLASTVWAIIICAEMK
jgi:hypothetical protein